MSVGQRIIEEICKQGMFRVSHPDPDAAHVFVWNANAEEQLEAIVMDYIFKRGLGDTVRYTDLPGWRKPQGDGSEG